MQKKIVPVVIAVLVLVSMACLCTGTGLTPPTSVPQQPQQPTSSVQSSGIITEIVMAKNTEGDALDPVDPTTVFGPDSTIHAVAKIKDAPSNTKFTAAFYVV